MNTKGRVQGKTIMDKPATYEIITHERNVVCSFSSIAKVVPKANMIPIKINENKKNTINTIDFFASISIDISDVSILYI
ncbi:MAG: hypothetical protein ACE5RP_03300 [Nitrosopumilus sp.]